MTIGPRQQHVEGVTRTSEFGAISKHHGELDRARGLERRSEQSRRLEAPSSVEGQRVDDIARSLRPRESQEPAQEAPQEISRERVDQLARDLAPNRDATEAVEALTRLRHEEIMTGETKDLAARARELGGEAREREKLGELTAERRLREFGCRLPVALGGGGEGGAMPDVIGLDQERRVRIVEAKGTLTGRGLNDMGLKRGDDPVSGEPIYENSREWLAKSGEKVLRHLDEKIEGEVDADKRAEFEELRDKYADLVEERFADTSKFETSVVQAGPDIPILNQERLPASIEDYVEAVRPAELMQYRLHGIGGSS